jgi:hypothetical protein
MRKILKHFWSSFETYLGIIHLTVASLTKNLRVDLAEYTTVMGDITPFMSPDGVMIEGRKQWRDHLKRTDSIEMGHSDVKYAQQEWNKKKEAHRDRLRGQLATVQEFDRPGAPIAPVKMSNLNVEMANRLHNRPMPERKEMIKMTLEQMKRMK